MKKAESRNARLGGQLADKQGMDKVEEWLKSKAISTDSREPVLCPITELRGSASG
jgi:hypothetical protein